jgi:transmembrane sensor
MDFQKIKDLYLKSLLDKAKPEEEAQIEAYLAAHPSKTALQKLKQNVKPKVVKGIFSLKNVAATIVLVVGCVALYLNVTKSNNTQWMVYTANEAAGFKNITLKDGSKIVLQNGSTLKVDIKFGEKDSRLLGLVGQAFFEVERDTAKPFIITTPMSEIKVLGTSFNVNSSNIDSKVMVNSGKVQVSNIQSHNDIILVKSEGVVDDGKVMHKSSFTNDNYLAWFTGKFKFNGVEIEGVIKDLNTFYNNKFQVSKSFNSACQLTADFDNQAIEDVVEVLTLSCEVSVKKDDNHYIVQ